MNPETVLALGSLPPFVVPDDFAPLMAVLADAFKQASEGKGSFRHGRGQPFERQPMMEIGRMVGPAGPIFQAMKKSQEAMGMLSRDERDAAAAELLGAINYLAGAVILIREQEQRP